MLRIHFLQQWYALIDSDMEVKLYLTLFPRAFAGLDHGSIAISDYTTILSFCRLLETIHALMQARGLLIYWGIALDTIIISASSSTSNRSGKRDREMHQTKKGIQRYFRMKAPVVIDADT